jgi:hypothetical protein
MGAGVVTAILVAITLAIGTIAEGCDTTLRACTSPPPPNKIDPKHMSLRGESRPDSTATMQS